MDCRQQRCLQTQRAHSGFAAGVDSEPHDEDARDYGNYCHEVEGAAPAFKAQNLHAAQIGCEKAARHPACAQQAAYDFSQASEAGSTGHPLRCCLVYSS